MITRTILERTNKVKSNQIGFRNGKIFILLRNRVPWCAIEITPDKLEFKTAYVDQGEIKGDALKVVATLVRTPELEEVIEEAVEEKLIPADILGILREKGSVHYGVIACDTTPEEFMEMNILQNGGC